MNDSLIGKPTIGPKIRKAQLMMCCLVAIMLASIAAIIIVVEKYEAEINSKIQKISLLKDNNFKEWGQEPGSEDNTYTHTFKLYQYSGNDTKVEQSNFVKSDVFAKTNYNFTFINASFGQGNTGIVSLVNLWRRHPLSSTDSQIKNFNLALNKVFNQETMSPIQSKFPVLFNKVTKSIKEELLPSFYTQYLWEFYFNDPILVNQTIFSPLKLPLQLQNKLLNTSSKYNWASVQGLKPWIKLCLSKYYVTEPYFLLKSYYDLNEQQMRSLIGPGSQMYSLTSALNATIRNNLHSKIKQLCSEDICTSQQLVAVQWAQAFLTRTPLMAQINLNKYTGDINKTHKKTQIQYSKSCEFYNNSQNCLSFAQTQELLTASTKNLYNFSFVNFIFENKQSPNIIEKFIHLQEGQAKSIIDYVTKYFFQEYTLSGTDKYIFSWIWLVYQNFNKIWSSYKDLLISNLFGRAFYEKWGNNACPQYFSFDPAIQKFSSICNKTGYKLGQNVESYFPYIRSYFFIDRQKFLIDTNMTLQQSQIFFHSENSPFYIRMQQILKNFNKQYKCQDSQCSYEQLAYRQWGSNDILSNLPAEYFKNNTASIIQWDTDDKVFHEYNIQYWNVMKKTLTFRQVESLMSYDQYGVLGQFSLKNRIDERSTKDPEQMIKYLNQILTNSIFSGTFINKNSYDYLFGYTDPYMESIREKSPLDGGKPWVTGIVGLADLNNENTINSLKITEYDELNSGIFNQKSLRTWKKKLGKLTTGYKYPVFMQNSNITYTWVDTGREVKGTNALGFQTSVSQNDVLNIFLQDLKRVIQFKYDSSVSSNKLKFKTVDNNEYDVGTDTLDGFYAKIVPEQSYMIVETATGQTIQYKMTIVWYIKPGKYLFEVDENTKAMLFQQVIEFKRLDQTKYNQIISTRHTKGVILPILITLTCLAFVGTLVVGFFVWRWRKNLIKLEEDFQNSNIESIDTREKDIENWENQNRI